MRNLIILLVGITLLFNNCNSNGKKKDKDNTEASSKVHVTSLTNEMFKQEIFNYEISKEWIFQGDLPVIIDFYADWCKPCKKLSPTIEEIAKEYSGKIIVYKVDTDAENLLAQNMGIQNLPTLFFIPVKGQPRSAMGLMPKEEIVRAINEVLLVH